MTLEVIEDFNARTVGVRKSIEDPQEDGGLSGPSSTRYYFGSEVMVEVPYDQTGGAWKQQNKMNGPIKVYRSLKHVD
jgi:hypothetical protein